MPMEILFYIYTISIILICVAASTAMVASYSITRNRLYLFVAGAFLFYFIDLSLIFQSEYLNHGELIGQESYYSIPMPLLKATLALGVLECAWVAILDYFGKLKPGIAAAPCVVYVAVIACIILFMDEGPMKQWCFYSIREAFLIWCIAYIMYLRKASDSPVTKARIRRLTPIIAAAAGVIACIIAENTFMILIWTPSAEVMRSVLPLYLSERNISEHILVLILAILALRRCFKTFQLRRGDTPQSSKDTQEQLVKATMDIFCERYGLTSRERDVLMCVVDGMDYQNTASNLHLAQGTVKSHMHNIYRKTDTKTKQELLQSFWRS